MKRYIEIHLKGHGKYVQPANMKDVIGAVEAELDGLDNGLIDDDFELTLKVVTMKESEYNKLPEFTGH